jgi:hypothetical protein
VSTICCHIALVGTPIIAFQRNRAHTQRSIYVLPDQVFDSIKQERFHSVICCCTKLTTACWWSLKLYFSAVSNGDIILLGLK